MEEEINTDNALEEWAPTDWTDFEEGGTPIDSKNLKNLNAGILHAIGKADSALDASAPQIGDVRMFAAETNPAQRFGGVWQVLNTHLYSGIWLYVRTA